MRKIFLVATLLLAACVVEERRHVERPGGPPPCPGAEWVGGHYDAWGHWHHAHWRCPSGEVIIVR